MLHEHVMLLWRPATAAEDIVKKRKYRVMFVDKVLDYPGRKDKKSRK